MNVTFTTVGLMEEQPENVIMPLVTDAAGAKTKNRSIWHVKYFAPESLCYSSIIFCACCCSLSLFKIALGQANT